MNESQSTYETREDGSGAVRLTEDQRHRMLAVELRRITIDVVAGLSMPTPLDEVASKVASRSQNSRAMESVERALHHRHLPMLTEAGLVEYDPVERTVARCNDVVSKLTA